MTLVVTGGSGFVGRNVIAQAKAEGLEAVALLRAGTKGDGLSHDGSIPQLTTALQKVNATGIVHCAAAFSPADDPAETPALIDANLALPISLLQAARAAGVTRFVNIGSLWEHAADGARQPINLYAATKTAFEDILSYLAPAHGIAAMTLKLSDTYGPGDTRAKLIPLLKAKLQEGAAFEMTAATQTVCYCHITDVSAAILQASQMLASAPPGHEAYVVEGDEPMVLKDMITMISAAMPLGLPVRFDAIPVDGKKPRVPWIGGPRLPGWSPKIPLLTGMLHIFQTESD